jgi:hypothetical protein
MDPSLERTLRGHKGGVSSVAFSPSVKQIASGSADNTVMLWNFKAQMRAFRFLGHKVSSQSSTIAACLLYDGYYHCIMLAGFRDGRVVLPGRRHPGIRVQGQDRASVGARTKGRVRHPERTHWCRAQRPILQRQQTPAH